MEVKMTKRQIPEEKISDYTQSYLKRNPKRGPKTPEEIAQSARNLQPKSSKLEKKKGYQQSIDSVFELNNLDAEQSYTSSQKEYYKHRYESITADIKTMDPYIASLVHFYVSQELQLKNYYREVNLPKLSPSEREKIMKMLSQSLENYQNLSNRLQMKHLDLHLETIDELRHTQDDLKNKLETASQQIKILITEKLLYEFKAKTMEDKLNKLMSKSGIAPSI